MNKILLAIVLGTLVIAAIGTFVAVKANASPNAEKITSCSSCQNKCTAENNCGSATCAAKTSGTCGCGLTK